MQLSLVLVLLKRLFGALIAKKMVMALLKIIVARTEPEWDDEALAIFDNLMNNDLDGVQKHSLRLAQIVADEIAKNKKNKEE